MPGPLAGVRILDCTEIIAAPYGAAMLSDLGAEVIKVEPPAGESWRLQNQFVPLESRSFMQLNRGKKSITLNLRDPRGQEAFYRLVPTADVMILNYRPDTPAKLGIDYETVSKINPGIVYVRNTAFGRKGRRASPRLRHHQPGLQRHHDELGARRRSITMATATPTSRRRHRLLAVTTGLYDREKRAAVSSSIPLLATSMVLQPAGLSIEAPTTRRLRA
jgi:hypothetical protein